MTNPKIATLSDHFDQGGINSALWSAPSGGALGSLGQSTITSTLTLSPAYCGVSFPFSVSIPTVTCNGVNSESVGLYSNLAYDLTGSGLSVGLVSWTPGTSGYSAQFTIGSGGNWVGFLLNNSPQVFAGDSAESGNWFTYTAAEFTYIRVRESSGTVYWDYSSDGITWTNAYSESDPFDLTSVHVSLVVTGSGSSPRGSAVWANVNYVL